ncbi:MAG: metallophosphoesterase [Cyanobium sp.]
MRLLQLSDPHLLADPAGLCRGRPALALLSHGLRAVHRQLQEQNLLPDRLLISGDLCQDESWGGYRRLEEALADSPFAGLEPPLLLAGNHDHPLALRAALGRRAVVGPALVEVGLWQVLLLDSHLSGRVGGRLGPRQLAWIDALLPASDHPLLVALHHPPLAIGDADLDAIGLEDGEALLDRLRHSGRWRGLVFGHIHQHWSGERRLADDSRGVPLLGCPSTLAPFRAVQACPLGRAGDPGCRLLDLGGDGILRHKLLRWDGPGPLPEGAAADNGQLAPAAP